MVGVDDTYAPSPQVFVTDLAGHTVLVPFQHPNDALDSKLVQLNPSARVVWDMLDGRRSLRMIIDAIAGHHGLAAVEIRRDVCTLVEGFLTQGFVITVDREGETA